MALHLRALSLCALSALALSGCSNSDQDRAVTTAIGESGFDLVSYTGTTRGAYIWPEGKSGHICAEPPPDLGLTTAREISANLKAAAETLGNIAAPSIDAGGVAKFSSAAIELAGRSQLVLLTREFLYRECELAANFAADPQKYKALSEQYEKVLKVVLALAEADRDKATKELLAVRIEAKKLNIIQDADIAKVVAHVGKADGSLDKDALKTLLAAAEIHPSFKQSIESRATVADLIDYLEIVPDEVTEALAAAVP